MVDQANIRLQLSRRLWDTQRFGLSPDKWKARVLNANEPKILCVSIPKSGTHLLERALCLHPRLYRRFIRTVNPTNVEQYGGLDQILENLNPGQIIVSHVFFSEDKLQAIRRNNVKVIFMVRDPRDVVISRAFYIDRQKEHKHHLLFAEKSDTRSKIILSICGDSSRGFMSIADVLDRYAGWLQSFSLPVRFEDLIGGEGGGSDQKKLETLREIYDYINMEISDEALHSIGRKLFSSKSPTFRKGSTGHWRDYFDPEVKGLFKEIAGDSLLCYEYEQDNQW